MRRLRRGTATLGVGLAVLGFGLPASASGEGAAPIGRDRRIYGSFYAAQWAVTRLPDMPGRVVTGRLRFRDSYFLGGGLGYVLIPRYSIPIPFCGGCALHGNSIEVEGTVVRHLNQQDHWEATAALVGRTGQIPLFLGAQMNLAAGFGLSYAFEDPKLEIGRHNVRGQDTYQLQFHLSLEAELMQEAVPGWSLVARIHHRSGAYGVLSPERTGSNFVGIGLRRSF